MPQCTAHTTRSTVNLLSLSTVTSATCATTVPNDSCTATPRPRFSPALPRRAACLQPALSAASSSAARWRGCLASMARRNSTGSLPAATASSSTNVSVENAVCVEPTERHQSTGHAVLGRMEIDRHVRNRVRQRRRAFHAGEVDAVLHHHRFERGAREDRLADDAVLPADDRCRSRRGLPSTCAGTSDGSSRLSCRPRASTPSSPGCRACRCARARPRSTRLRARSRTSALARRPKLPPAKSMLSLICSGLSPVYLRDRELVAGLELLAVPDLARVLR